MHPLDDLCVEAAGLAEVPNDGISCAKDTRSQYTQGPTCVKALYQNLLSRAWGWYL